VPEVLLPPVNIGAVAGSIVVGCLSRERLALPKPWSNSRRLLREIRLEGHKLPDVGCPLI
jgi:hypothetical protein